MRPKKREITVRWENVPAGSRALADRRTADLLMFYGRHISTISIHDLVASAYLQGLNDMFDFMEPKQTSDFQI